MPLKSGKSKKTISKNISEFHGGKTFAKTAKKFGKAKANKQAVAVAFSKAGKSKRKTKQNPSYEQVAKSVQKAKGYYGARSKVFRVANQAVTKAAQYAYRDRRQRKRQFRALWIVRINAAAHEHGLSYSRLINGLKKAAIAIDRKVLADLAVLDKPAFAILAEQAKAALSAA